MTIQSIVDELARSIKRPITVEDREGLLIAYSVHEGPVDPVRLETLLRKGASAATIDTLKARGVYRAIELSHAPIRVAPIPDIGFTSRISAPIRHGAGILGYLWVADEGIDIPGAMEDAIRDTCHRLARQLSGAEQSSDLRAQAEFVAELIGEHPPDRASALVKARSLGWQMRPPYRAVVIRRADRRVDSPEAVSRDGSTVGFRGRSQDDVTLTVEQFLLEMGAGWLKRVSDNETVLLCSQCAQDEARWPVEMSGAAGPLVGIGTGGESIAHFGQSYREALSAIDIARRLGLPGTCFHYVALMAYEIGAELLRCGSPGNFAAGLVQKVFEYDKVKEGELLDTLEVYLDLLGERRKAARALNIHANTLDYRIRRIKDIMGVDFDAPELRLPVHLWVKAKKVELASGLVSAQ